MEKQAAQWTEVRSDTRQAGNVMRYHTWPTIRQQTIADHSWNVWRIINAIWGISYGTDIPHHVTEHIMLHDCGELRTGDAPYPIKRDNPELKRVMDRLEDESLAEQGIFLSKITEQWKWRIKVGHTIEMMEFGLEELLLGSAHAGPVVLRMRVWLDEQMASPPAGVTPLEVIHVSKYVEARMQRTASSVRHMNDAIALTMRSTPRRSVSEPAPRPGTPDDGGHHGVGAQDE